MAVHQVVRRIRRPVYRQPAAYYLQLILLSFAASVVLTRLTLQLTGYPSLSTGDLHIAHVLWGGLLLFAAALFPLLFINRWVYAASAIGIGAGMGLFVDEVGKFITRTNDYFHPAAAPIIYAFFLLTVLLYVEVRKPKPSDARTELYLALEGLQEVLDRDLEAHERDELVTRLRGIAEHASDPEMARLASELLDYLLYGGVTLAEDRPGRVERAIRHVQAWEEKWLTRRRLKLGTVVGLAALGAVGLWRWIPLLTAAQDPGRLVRLLEPLIVAGRISGQGGLGWFGAWLALEGLVGVMLVVSALLLLGPEGFGIYLAHLALLVSLTVVDLMVFYFDQFSTVVLALGQLTVFLLLNSYRRRFLPGRRPVR